MGTREQNTDIHLPGSADVLTIVAQSRGSAVRFEPLRAWAAHVVQLRPITIPQDAHDFSEYCRKIHTIELHPMFTLVVPLVRTGAVTPVL
jgi:hypothetical protein